MLFLQLLQKKHVKFKTKENDPVTKHTRILMRLMRFDKIIDSNYRFPGVCLNGQTFQSTLQMFKINAIEMRTSSFFTVG